MLSAKQSIELEKTGISTEAKKGIVTPLNYCARYSWKELNFQYTEVEYVIWYDDKSHFTLSEL